MALRHVAAVAVVALACVACGDDDEPEAVDTTTASTEPPPSTASPTTEPPATTEPPVITEASTTTTTTSTTTTSTTTTVAPTTVAPADPGADALAALKRFRSWRVECIRSLPRCDVSVLPQYVVGAELDDLRQFHTAQNEAQYFATGLETLRDVFEEVRPTDDPRRFEIVLCTEDGTTLIQQLATETTIVDSTFYSTRLLADMRLDDDNVWRLYSYVQLAQTQGQENTLCA